MPILHWLNRDESLTVADKTPYRVLEEVPSLSRGEEGTQNMLVQGDNLDALKSLLPYYAGQVKCIYIDPPYNTGHAFEHYDDNVEHSTWLSLMLPRLTLLRDFLSEDGSIWISIDDDEGHYLKVLCDEVFGRANFINTVVWEKKYSPANDAKWLSDSHDFILVYAKRKEVWRPNLLQRTAEMNSRYKNLDNDVRGPWKPGDISVRTYNANSDYPITTPTGRIVNPPLGRCWAFSKEKFTELVAENRIWFGKDGNNVPAVKRFLNEVKDGMTAMTIWKYSEVGHNQDAKKEAKVFNSENVFATPKPERLLERILTLASNPGDLVMDSFLGSGTTAAVAHKMGRQYIGIEMGDHAVTHCVPRLEKVIDGEQGGISKSVGWQGGGGFRFYRLGETVFDEYGEINPDISFDALASHIWFTETYQPRQLGAPLSTCLGVHQRTAYSLLYNGVLKDRSVSGGNVLTRKTLAIILEDIGEAEYDKIVVYGESCRLSPATLQEYRIVFKQTPYDVRS